jgi:CxxC motif-containing protein (DUF1111 family)
MLLFSAVLLGTWGCAQDPLDGLTVVGEDPTDRPLRGLDDGWMARFDSGDVHFERVFRDTTGLGPLYIRHACASCHEADGRGPGAITKMVVVGADGVTPSDDQSALPFGHTARTQLAADATQPIVPPEGADDVLVTRRFGPPVFGRGYLEAIADAEIERIALEQAARTDLIHGRINRVAWQSEANEGSPFHAYGPGSADLIGRFGLKARIATVDEFVADAYQGDMGITSPLRPEELANPEGLGDDLLAGVDVDAEAVNDTADYVRLLRIPERPAPDASGASLFEEVLCAVCHVPAMRTRDDYPIPQLAGIDAPIYSDLLLHDMGDGLADGIVEGEAGPRDWKTAPLVGLRHMTSFLHDGRAGSVAEAIAAHRSTGSEANDSIDRYDELSADEQAALLGFVEGL